MPWRAPGGDHPTVTSDIVVSWQAVVRRTVPPTQSVLYPAHYGLGTTSTMPTKLPIVLGAGLLASACLLTACPAAEEEPDRLIGLWRSTESIGGNRNELEIGPDLIGSATIYFYFDESLYYADFTAVAFADEPNRLYEIEMLCEGGCSEFDFQMDCIMVSDSELKCDGDGGFEGYEGLDFRRY